jgi:processive 1,2-diacylglycerol beta-glucosyltransferase
VDLRDFLTALPRWAAWLLGEGYTTSVDRAPFIYQTVFRLVERRGLVWRAMRWLAALGARTVLDWLARGSYGAVVAIYPIAAQCLGRLREQGRCPVPVVIYLTDPAVHAGWVHAGADRHVTVTQATADDGANTYGVPMVAGGPLVPQRFAHPAPERELASLRCQLALPAGKPVALLVAGSLGIGDLLPTTVEVAAAGLVPVVLCGCNDRLRRQIESVPGAVALGWRSDVHLLMRLADVLVQNAGGLSLTEALVAGLPALTCRAIPGHGRANADLLDRAGLAPWVRDPADLAGALHRQIAGGRRPSPAGDPTTQVLEVLSASRPVTP